MASQFLFEAIGTHWQIDIYQDLSEQQEGAVIFEVRSRIELFEQHYSRFREDSLIAQMAISAGKFIMPDDAEPLLDLYKELYDATDGLVTPLIGSVLADAGYNAQYSLKQIKGLVVPPAWEEVLSYSHPVLEIKKPIQLDFGALGKGYIIDIVAAVLEEQGIDSYCIDAGGDMLQKGNTAIRVALEDPTDPSKAYGVVELHNQSICGSAGNRRKWQQFHHIINPHTLQSPTNILAVWVLADTALLADGCTTCLFFISPTELVQKLKKHSFEYFLVRDDFSFEKSDGFILLD
jgi:thiamine biosynthesis lipoprotein